MQVSILTLVTSLLSLTLLSSLSRAAPPNVGKVSPDDVKAMEDDVSSDADLAKRLSQFVRIGRPSHFVRIGRGSSFIRIGRPGNFVRIGRGYEGAPGEDSYEVDNTELPTDKRASRFVRIGKASRFGCQGSADPDCLNKRLSSFVRIGKSVSDPYDSLDNDDNKRMSSFVRIGRIPSSAFVRIGRDPSDSSGEVEDFGTFDRIARMGQSSFVRIGKREADPEKLAQSAQAQSDADQQQ